MPSFNNELKPLYNPKKKNFFIIGSAHNLKEIKIKELQKVQSIVISSLFKKNKNYLGLYKFKILKNYTQKRVIALGWITKKNIKKISLLNISSIAGISYFE